jgi:hypothetical protein
MRCFFPNPPLPDLGIALAVRAAIDWLAPKWWIVENVYASRRWLDLIYGPPFVSSRSDVFWGHIPTLLPQLKPHKSGGGSKSSGRKAYAARNPAARAKVPYEIGETICRAVESRNEEAQC